QKNDACVNDSVAIRREYKVEVIRILARQIIRFAATADSRFIDIAAETVVVYAWIHGLWFWLAYAFVLFSVDATAVLFPLSMACDDTDVCVTTVIDSSVVLANQHATVFAAMADLLILREYTLY
nr:hypothetical protein [Tanacetum cinerariifolium]